MRRYSRQIVVALNLLLHAYVAWRLLPALSLNPLALGLAILAFSVSGFLTPAPLLLRLANLPERVADLLAWTGYLAMGIFSTLLILTWARDIVLLVLAGWNTLLPDSIDLADVERVSAIAVLAMTALVSVVGIVNARRTARVVNMDLPIAGLPKALEGFTIVQLSDIHAGPTIKYPYVAAIVRRANALDADLIAITGDVIDGTVERLREHVAPLAQLRSRHGTYCVTGNHEYYHGVHDWLDEWRRLGFQVLINQGRLIDHDGERLLIGGVTDYNGHHFDERHRSDPDAAARVDNKVAIRILLAHQPRSATAAEKAGFDIQLSGHTHGGQFLPWNYFVPMQQPFVAGLQRLNGLLVYTSRGAGYWGPPIRFGAPSEITCLRLVSA